MLVFTTPGRSTVVDERKEQFKGEAAETEERERRRERRNKNFFI
jgi:hypothetical protein